MLAAIYSEATQQGIQVEPEDSSSWARRLSRWLVGQAARASEDSRRNNNKAFSSRTQINVDMSHAYKEGEGEEGEGEGEEGEEEEEEEEEGEGEGEEGEGEGEGDDDYDHGRGSVWGDLHHLLQEAHIGYERRSGSLPEHCLADGTSADRTASGSLCISQHDLMVRCYAPALQTVFKAIAGGGEEINEINEYGHGPGSTTTTLARARAHALAPLSAIATHMMYAMCAFQSANIELNPAWAVILVILTLTLTQTLPRTRTLTLTLTLTLIR